MPLRHAIKILLCFFVQIKFGVAFTCAKKILRCIFMLHFVQQFFRCSDNATKIAMKVLSTEAKQCCRF